MSNGIWPRRTTSPACVSRFLVDGIGAKVMRGLLPSVVAADPKPVYCNVQPWHVAPSRQGWHSGLCGCNGQRAEHHTDRHHQPPPTSHHLRRTNPCEHVSPRQGHRAERWCPRSQPVLTFLTSHPVAVRVERCPSSQRSST